MKILYSITKSEIGGAQMHVAQLAKGMKDTGNPVAIVAAPGGWLEYEATRLGIRFYPNPYFANSFNPFRLKKSFSLIQNIVSEFQPDIVHAHSSFAGIVTRLAVKNKIPTVFTAHSWAFTDGASLFRKIIAPISERFVSKFTSKIICVSEYDRQLALRYKIAPENKLTTIYNGVAVYPQSIEEKENFLLSVGRFDYPKEYVLLIQSFAEANIAGMRLKIIGNGPDEEKMRHVAEELGVSNMVSIITDVSHEFVRQEMNKSSAFVLISKHEGFPLVILEAMSAGLPVIASNVGGIPEEIDSSCGILVKNTSKDISNALRLLSDDQKRKEMGEAAKKRFEEKFKLEKFLEVTEKIYKDLL